MPRIQRGFGDNQVYHVINRGNNKARVFHKPEDYLAFVRLIGEAKNRYQVSLFAFCLMPNHIHLLVRPTHAEDLSRWMHWLMSSHVRKYQAHYGGVGHVWQGRYKSFLIQADNHLLMVARYIEGNPVRAGLTKTALEWPWSSHLETVGIQGRILTDDLPIDLPADWTQYVDTPMNEVELEKLRLSIARQRPYGDEIWQKAVCEEYHLESTMHPHGRPKEKGKGDRPHFEKNGACPLF